MRALRYGRETRVEETSGDPKTVLTAELGREGDQAPAREMHAPRKLMSNALVPALTVVMAALVLQVSASAIAPRFAPKPRAAGPGEYGTTMFSAGPGLAIPGLEGALSTAEPTLRPSSDPTAAPRPTSPDTQVLSISEERDDDQPESTPTALPTDEPSASIAASIGVSARRVAPGGELKYRYVATNNGDGTFQGTIGLTTHAPAGTLRCSDDLGGACLVPGDYTGGSRSPSEGHMNPEAVTRTVTIRPGGRAVLFVMRVQVSQAAENGLVLRNHGHLDGTRSGRGVITVDAPRVRVSGGAT